MIICVADYRMIRRGFDASHDDVMKGTGGIDAGLFGHNQRMADEGANVNISRASPTSSLLSHKKVWKGLRFKVIPEPLDAAAKARRAVF